MIEIPLTSDVEQLFSITLESQTYDIRVTLSSRTKIWTISFSQNGISILQGIPLLGGIDILDQYNVPPITNTYMVNIDNPRLDPSKDGLGTSSKLTILTEEEIENG